MAKRRSRKRRFNLRGVRVTPARTLTTLAAATAITSGTTGVAVTPYRLMTAKLVWALTGLTAGEGPITCGYAHSDYSATEIKEAIESAASIDLGNLQAREQSERLVRIVGTFGAVAAGAELNDGNPISTKLNWLISIGDQVNIFAWNEDTSALTTGASLNAVGTMWLKDSV